MPDNDLDAYLDPLPKSRRGNYDEIINRHAQRTGLDPEFVRAVVHQESGGNRRAVSRKGAQGLGQLMPATAKRFGVKDPFDPEQNIRGATDYLKFLNDRFKGNRDLVLAGYNAGEGAVDKFKGIPPYKETRNYVKSINARLGQRQRQPKPTTDLDGYLDPVTDESLPPKAEVPSINRTPVETATPSATNPPPRRGSPSRTPRVIPYWERVRSRMQGQAQPAPPRTPTIQIPDWMRRQNQNRAIELQQRQQQEAATAEAKQELDSRRTYLTAGRGRFSIPSATGVLAAASNPFGAVSDLFKSDEEQINELTTENLRRQQVAQEPEVESIRKEYGQMSAPQRVAVSSLAKGGAGLLDFVGGLAELGGTLPKGVIPPADKLSNWAKKRSEIIETGASMAPLQEERGLSSLITDETKLKEVDRGFFEKIATAAADVGVGVGQVILLKKATGLKFNQVLALEAAARNSEKPLSEQLARTAEAYALGTALDRRMSRKVSAAISAVPTAVQTGYEVTQGRMSPLDAAIQTGVQAATGAVLTSPPSRKVKQVEKYLDEPRMTPEQARAQQRADFDEAVREGIGAPVPAADEPVVKPSTASVKAFITRADEAALKQRGYTDEQIYKMKPAEAQQILEGIANEPQVQTKPPVETQRAEAGPRPAVAEVGQPRVSDVSETRTANIRAADTQLPAEPAQPERPISGIERSDLDATGIRPSAEFAPQRFFHRDFGEVTESPNQRRVGKGRVRVVGEDGKEHVIKRSAMTGRGNERAVPIRESEPDVANVTGTPDLPPEKAEWYHGTRSDFKEFRVGEGAADLGAYLTSDKALAERYTTEDVHGETGTPRVVTASARPSKVLDTRFGRADLGALDRLLDSLLARAEKLDFDKGATKKFRAAKEELHGARSVGAWKAAEAKIYDGAMDLNRAEGDTKFASVRPLREELLKQDYDAVRKVDDGADALVVLKPEVLSIKPDVGEAGDVTKASLPASPEPVAESITSARKAQMAQDRAELDLPELPPAQRKSWAKSLDEAKPEQANRLADEVLNKPRGLSDSETASIVVRAQQVKNEHKAKLQEIEQADDAALPRLQSELATLEREFDLLTQATKASGTEKGRALAAQKLTINQDFDLVSLVAQFKAASGRKPNSKERAQIEHLVKENTRLEAALAKMESERVQGQIQDQINRIQRTQRRTQTKTQIDDEWTQLKSQFAEIRQREAGFFKSEEGAFDPEAVKLIGKMVRNRVQAGVVSAEQLIDDIHAITGGDRRELRDTISGYRMTPLYTRTELQKQIDALKSELQQLSKTEDIEAGVRSPRREGPRRSEARQLPMEGPRKSEERSSGIPKQGPRLSDVRQVQEQGPRLSEGTGRKQGPRVEDAPFVGPRPSDARRLPAEGPRVEDAPFVGPRKSDVRRLPMEGPRITDAPLQGPRLSDVRRVPEQGPQMVEHGPPRSIFQKDVNRRKQIERQIADLEQQMTSGVFKDTKHKEPPRYTRETYALQKELDATRAEYERLKYKATATVGEKVKDTSLGLGNTPKTILSMGDVSALLRQGGYGYVTHPVLSTKAAQDMVRSISERGFANVEAALKSHPQFENAKRDGVEFTGVDRLDPRLNKREEGYLGSGFIDTLSKGKYNPLKYTVKPLKDISERTFVSFLDSQRLRIYAAQANAIRSMKGLTEAQQRDALRTIASQVNIATGRGNLGARGNAAAPVLNMAMFSPRLLASRIQLLNRMFNPVAMKNMSPGARRLIMIDNAKFLGFTMLTLGLARAAGLGVSLDPDDSEFLKIKVGNTRYDTLTGLQQPMRLFLRMVGYGGSQVGGAMRGSETYSGDPAGKILLDFTRSKASPEAGYLWDAIEGKNRMTGKRFEAGRDAARQLVPLPMQDFNEAIKTDGVARGFVEALPSLAGIGAQTYLGAAEKPTTQAEKLARRFIKERMPDEARTQEDIDIDAKRSQLRARSRAGEDVSADLDQLKGKITDRQVKAILSARNHTRLQEDVNRLGIKDALNVYSVANSQQRAELKELLEKKTSLVNTLLPDEQQQVRQRLQQLGITVPNIRISRPSRESRQSRATR